jgi:hypothetical protein
VIVCVWGGGGGGGLWGVFVVYGGVGTSTLKDSVSGRDGAYAHIASQDGGGRGVCLMSMTMRDRGRGCDSGCGCGCCRDRRCGGGGGGE